MIVYILVSLFCLFSFLFLNWYDKQDLTVGDLLVFSLISMIPLLNILVLIFSVVEFSLSKKIVVLKGRK